MIIKYFFSEHNYQLFTIPAAYVKQKLVIIHKTAVDHTMHAILSWTQLHSHRVGAPIVTIGGGGVIYHTRCEPVVKNHHHNID